MPFDLDLALADPLALAAWFLDEGTVRVNAESCRKAAQSLT